MARGQAISSMVFNKPQLIALDDLQPIVDYLANPNRSDILRLDRDIEEDVELKLSDFDDNESYERYKLMSVGINPDTMVGLLDISGSLMYRKGSMGANCRELTSYEGLKLQTQNMLDNGAESIVMMVDSGGGMAFGMFAAANHIKKICKQSGVKTTAYVDGVSASAALGLTVLADEVVVNPQSMVGSVGVVVALYNDSKRLEKAGVSRQFVFAGGNKIPFDNETGEFTDKFISDLQKSVNKTYNSFVSHIATMRNLDEKVVRDTEASMFDAEEALELGFVDKIMELEDFELQYGLKKPSGVSNQVGMAMSVNDNNKPKVEDAMTVDSKNKDKGDELLSDAPTLTNEDVNMTKELQAKLETVAGENKVLASQVDELTKQLKASNDKAVELSTLVEQKALEQRNDARKLLLENALGKDSDKVETLLVSTSMLSDEQFEVVAGSFALAQETTQENLKEHGGEGQESLVQLDLSQQFKKTAETMNSRKA